MKSSTVSLLYTVESPYQTLRMLFYLMCASITTILLMLSVTAFRKVFSEILFFNSSNAVLYYLNDVLLLREDIRSSKLEAFLEFNEANLGYMYIFSIFYKFSGISINCSF